MSADSEAYALSLRVSPELTDAEREYALIVARHESFFGRATKPTAWVGSHNWGAVQGRGPAGSFQTGDTHEDGSGYVGTFKRYNSDEEGWADLVRILLKPNVRAALADGDAAAACAAQRANGYFEAPLARYIEALKRNYTAFAAATGKSALHFPLVSGPSSPSSPALPGSPFVIRHAANLPTLQEGSFGEAVKAFCALLHIALAPRFDARVLAAALDYQRAHGLKPDGIVGPKTWAHVLGDNP